MQWNKFLPAVVVVFLWYLIWDNLLSGPLMGSIMAAIGLQEPVKLWEVVGDLAAALVLVWVYDRVRAAFAEGFKGGLTYGLYAGILINFPTWLWMTVYNAWPYGATWKATIILIVVTVVSGALIGMVYQKVGGAKAA